MWAPENELFNIEEATVVKQTDKAIQVLAKSLKYPTWIPHSIVSDDSEVWKPGHVGTLIVQAWWARKQGWW